MNNPAEKIRGWLRNLVFGDIPYGKQLPKHVQDVKINPSFMMLHMMSAEKPSPPRYKKALEDDII